MDDLVTEIGFLSPEISSKGNTKTNIEIGDVPYEKWDGEDRDEEHDMLNGGTMIRCAKHNKNNVSDN